MSRKVIVSEPIWNKELNRYVPAEKGIAEFHQFGIDYEELSDGPAQFTTAIVEWPDGTIENLPLYLVKFKKTYQFKELSESEILQAEKMYTGGTLTHLREI